MENPYYCNAFQRKIVEKNEILTNHKLQFLFST